MTLESINPVNGQVIKTYQSYSDETIEAMLVKGHDAFQHHRKATYDERAQKMRSVASYLDEHKAEFASLATMEMGKTYLSALAEVEKCASLCRYYADHAEIFLADQVVETQAARSFVRYLPIGIVLAVMPWNFPFWQVFRFAVPALMAGNVGLLKHASNVSGCALAIEEAFSLNGFGKGAFQTLLIGSDKVAQIIADDRISAVTLTGSEKAGSAVAAQAGQYLKKAVLELGGSDPFIVMPSADIDHALDLAVKGRVQNNGQTCIAAKRYIIHSDIYDAFRAQLIEHFESLVVGDPMDEKTDVGPLSSAQIRNELQEQVTETVRLGAVKLCGAEIMAGEGNFYRPGLLENIPPDSPAYKDELFGPVGLLFKVADMDQAIALANDTRFGLGSVICTQDEGEVARAINEIDAGVTFVNDTVSSNPALPFGGTKKSGFGRELSAEGIREFTNIKTVVAR
tara:strand:- start:7670 stop:9034 length:1365 start_codon:yes stop_codon:yes gene_type:complete